MQLALRNPGMIDRLIVVDVAPKEVKLKDLDQMRYMKAMKELPLDTIKSRKDADEYLKPIVYDPSVRQFLLTNLQSDHNGRWYWRINLPAIENFFPVLRNFSFSPNEVAYINPTLFIAGSRSNYILPEDHKAIKNLFPNAEVTSLDTGHWVHSEKPLEFIKVVLQFLEKTSVN